MLRNILLFIERAGNSLRRRINRVYYGCTLGRVGRNCVFDRGLRIFGKQFVFVGEGVNFNDGVTVQSCEGASVTIGNGVTLSYDCLILTGGLERHRGADCRGSPWAGDR